MNEHGSNWAQYRFIIKELVIREFKRKYSRSFLGVIWSVLSPLLMMAVLSLIFTQLLGRDIPNFPVYVLTGIMIIQLFNNATNAGMTTLVDNKNMLIKVKFPLEIFVLAKTCVAVVDFAFSLVAYVVILMVFRIPLSGYMLFYPVVLLFLFFFTLGVSFVLSVAYVYFGDIKHLWSVVTMMLMWLSAVFWPIERLTGWPERIARANPMFNFINSSRQAIMWQQFPSFNQNLQMVTWSVVAFVIGWIIFRKNRVKILTKI